MRKKTVLWVLAGLAFFLFLRGTLLLVPLYIWGRTQGIRISISPLSSFGAKHLELRRLRVRDPQGNLFFSADRLTGAYNPHLLLHGKFTSSFSSVDLDKPRLLLSRNPEGKWSPSFLSKELSWIETLKTEINVLHGEVKIFDEFWKLGAKPSDISILPIEGTVDFALPSRVTVNLAADTYSGGAITMNGELSRPSYSGILGLKMQRLPLASFGNYLLHRRTLRFTSGTLHGEAKFWVSRFVIPSASAVFHVSKGTLVGTQVNGLRLTNLSSNLAFGKYLLQLSDIQGRLGSSPFNGKGIVALSTVPRYSFAFHSPDFALSGLNGLSDLIGKLNPRGRATFDLLLTGQDSDFLWEGTLEAPRFSLNSSPESNLSIHFSNLDDLFYLDRAQWKGNGSRVSIQGTAKHDEYASFLIQGKNIPFDWLKGASPLDFKLSTLNFQHLTALFDRFHGKETLAATGELQSFTVLKTKIARFRSRFLFSANEGWLDDLALTLKTGKLSGNAVWLGSANPLLGGELQGRFENKSLHPYLFGQEKDLYLVEPSAFIHGIFPSGVSGMIDVAQWPVHLNFNAASLHALASGIFLFRMEPGHPASGFGFGQLAGAKGESGFRLAIANATTFSDNANWSLGVSEGHGGISMVSPSLALFGQTGLHKSRFFFATHSAPAPLSWGAAGQILYEKKLPLFSLSVSGNGPWRRKPSAFSGDLSGSDKEVRLDHLEGVWGSGLYDLSGRLSLPLGGPLSLRGSTADSEISDLIKLAHNSPPWLRGLSGNLSGNFNVWTGGKRSLAGDLHFFVRDGNFWGQPVSTAYVDSRIRNGILKFNPLVVRSREDYFFARGTAGLNGKMNFSFNVPQLSLAHVAALNPQRRNLDGFLEMQGNLNGSIFSPTVGAKITMNHFQADRIHVEKIRAQVLYQNKTFQIRQAQLINGSGDLSGSATLALGSPPRLKSDLSFSRFDLESLLSWHALRSLGLLDGSVVLSGPLPRVNGNFDLHFSEQGIPTGEASGIFNKGTASFSALKLRIGNGEISGSGKLNVQKPSSLHVEGSNLDLQFLAQLLQWPVSLAGLGSFKGEVKTSLENPEMDVQVSLTRPTYAQFSASSFNAKLRYTHGKIFVAEGRAVLPHGVFQLEGYIPISLGRNKKIRSPFTLRLKLENQDLKLLSDLDPKITAGGLANAEFKVSFQPDHYLIDGKAGVQNGTLLLPGMENEIESLEGFLQVDQNTLRFNARGDLSNPILSSGTFRISGDYASPVLEDGQLQLTGNRLAVHIPYAQVHLTPDLRLSYESRLWKLTGNATVEDGDVSTELFTTSLQRQLFPKLGQLELDVAVNVNEKVHFHHPHLEAQGSGFLKIGGIVSHPALSGELSGNHGTLVFLGHEFTLTRGSATFSPKRALPYLSLEGVSIRRIQGSQIILKLSGYPGDLHLEIASDPPLTQNELSATLTQHQPVERYLSGERNQFVQQEASRWLNTGLTSEVFYPIENVFGSAFKLEYFSFEFLPTGQLGLQVGKEISPHLAVTYSRPVAGRIQSQNDPGAVWGLDYHLSRQILLRGTQDNITGFGGQILSKWNF